MSANAEDMARWHAALEVAERTARRTAEAQQQIADARAEPTSVEIEAQMADARSIDPYDEAAAREAPPDTITLSGAKLEAYRKLEAAAGAAHAAQQSMATTGAALREAIQGLCAAMTSGER